jgi:hypothetical protein
MEALYNRLSGRVYVSVGLSLSLLLTNPNASLKTNHFQGSMHIIMSNNLSVSSSTKEFPHHSSVNRSSKLILNIITNNPIVTIINNANPNQPSIIADVPTPLFTLPFPKSCAIVLAATDAVCCHSTDTSTKTEAMKMRASAT